MANKNKPYTEAAEAIAATTTECLQTLYDNINKGQQKQIVKIPEIKAMFDFYGVEY